MTGQQVSEFLKARVAAATAWLKVIIAFVLTVMVGATLATILGHPIPYIPAFRGSLQEAGIFIAALAYWLR